MRRRELPIHEPCDADWDAMEGGETRRFCGRCDKHVHDLSAMTEGAARALLAAHAGGHLCVQYATDASGRLQFRTPAPRLRRLPVIAGVGGALLAGCAGDVGVFPEPGDAGADAAPEDGGAGPDAADLNGPDPEEHDGITTPGSFAGAAPCASSASTPPHVAGTSDDPAAATKTNDGAAPGSDTGAATASGDGAGAAGDAPTTLGYAAPHKIMGRIPIHRPVRGKVAIKTRGEVMLGDVLAPGERIE